MPFKNGVPCICEICICGRHACPHRKKKQGHVESYGPDTKSEYSKSYVPQQCIRPEPMIPKSQIITDSTPFSVTSTHKEDYIKHPLGEITRHRPPSFVGNDMEMDLSTMYSKDFCPKPFDLRKPTVHISRVEPAEFKGQSTHKADYRPWEVEVPKRREPDKWQPPSDRMDAVPLYSLEYKAHKYTPPKSFKPQPSISAGGEPFDGITGYQEQYVKHDLEPPTDKKKSIWAKPAAPFDGITTFQRDYVAKPYSKVKPFEAKQSTLQSDEKFSSESTTKRDYVPWALSLPERNSRPDYVPPEGEFEFGTMYNTHFVPHPVSEKQSAFVSAHRSSSPSPFDGTTQYQTEYKHWNTKVPARAKPSVTWKTPLEPMNGITSYSTEYIPRKIVPSKPCKRTESIATSHDPMQGTSIYKDEFVEKLIQCPAALLDTPMAKHTYKETDEATGHKFYEPLYVTIRDEKSKKYTDVPIIKNNNGEYSFMLPGSQTKNIVVAEA